MLTLNKPFIALFVSVVLLSGCSSVPTNVSKESNTPEGVKYKIYEHYHFSAERGNEPGVFFVVHTLNHKITRQASSVSDAFRSIPSSSLLYQVFYVQRNSLTKQYEVFLGGGVGTGSLTVTPEFTYVECRASYNFRGAHAAMCDHDTTESADILNSYGSFTRYLGGPSTSNPRKPSRKKMEAYVLKTKMLFKAKEYFDSHMPPTSVKEIKAARLTQAVMDRYEHYKYLPIPKR